MEFLILHAYSAQNAGDGLLVEEAIEVIKDRFGHDASITLMASHPRTFDRFGVSVVNSLPRSWSESKTYARILRRIDSFDLVVGVGGGYLRAGHPMEALRSAIVHGPQLWAASRRTGPVVYLPQSIGPAAFGLRAPLSRLLRGIDVVYVRDDRSVNEFGDVALRRRPDMALIAKDAVDTVSDIPTGRPILSVRAIRGTVPQRVQTLASIVKEFDGYIQSTTGGNNDVSAMESLSPVVTVPRHELISARAEGRRVVVAVRLHAALMALNAGHFVIHLAYERKGFGAFQDLGLDDFVHNVNSFDPKHVHHQIREFYESAHRRESYAEAVGVARRRLAQSRDVLESDLAALMGTATWEGRGRK
ncbi:polysaccharide pyruvyl transferase family protein [Rhodococcus sp. NPDC057014]|uniref:polysaccharide pyruvyl transferase family protein n=1 Tax=Rhodococcus sp. NPDC057014 TaxID=3346000 RepID=UPI003630E6F3